MDSVFLWLHGPQSSGGHVNRQKCYSGADADTEIEGAPASAFRMRRVAGSIARRSAK